MSTPENDRRVDYLEFTTRNVAAAKLFYAAALGWTFTDFGPDYTSFHDGRLSGGFTIGDSKPAKTNPLVVIYATDLSAVESRVRKAGGQIVRATYEFPGGRRFHFTDPDGLELAVWSE
jgi:predicted enzyme related to lactoylglutathione lyase